MKFLVCNYIKMEKKFLISPNISIESIDYGKVWNEFFCSEKSEGINSLGGFTSLPPLDNGKLKNTTGDKFSILKVSLRCGDIEKKRVIENNIQFDQIKKKTVIEIFRDEMDSRFLGRLRDLYPKTDRKKYRGFHPNELIALSVCMMYPETIQQYINWKKSNNASKKVFCTGFKKLQETVDDSLVNDFYSSVRCGLFHMGSLNNDWLISYRMSSKKVIIEKLSDGKFIYLDNFIDAIIKHFEGYIKKLKRKDSSFYKKFEQLYKEELKPYFISK